MERGRALAWSRGPRARSPSTSSTPQRPLPGVAAVKTEGALLPWSWEGHGEQAVCMAGVPSQSSMRGPTCEFQLPSPSALTWDVCIEREGDPVRKRMSA